MSPSEDGDTERQPLLATTVKESRSNAPFARLFPRFDTIDSRYRFVPLLGCLIIVLNEGEYFVKQAALFRVVESLHCIEYYNSRDPNLARLGRHIPEKLCKADLIQKHVAETNAMNTFVRMTCALVGTIPLGWLADKKGRKFVLVVHKVNLICSCAIQIFIYLTYPLLPVRSIFLSGVPALFGGNFDLGLVMLFASYADVMPVARQRNTLFFLTTSMQYVGQSLIPPLGGLLLNLDGEGGTSEVSLFVSLAFSFAAFFVTFFLFPDTMKRSQEDGSTIEGREDIDRNTYPSADGSDNPRSSTCLRERLMNVRVLLGKLLKRPDVASIGLIALAVFCSSLGIKMNDWYGLVQFPVVKFGWTFSQTTFIVSIQAIVSLINYALLLPTYNRCAAFYGYSVPMASIMIMLFSCVVLIVGSTCLGFSWTILTFFGAMVVYTLGNGVTTAAQAYVTDLVDKKSLARVLSVLSVMAVAGKSSASLIFPKLFAAGLDSKADVLRGLNFFVAAGLFLISGICTAVVWHRHYRVEDWFKKAAELAGGE